MFRNIICFISQIISDAVQETTIEGNRIKEEKQKRKLITIPTGDEISDFPSNSINHTIIDSNFMNNYLSIDNHEKRDIDRLLQKFKNDIKSIKNIGEGGFGKVYKIEFISPSADTCVVKVVSNDLDGGKEEERNSSCVFNNHSHLLKSFPERNFKDNDNIFLFYEFIGFDNLNTFRNKMNSPIDLREELIWEMIYQMHSALEYMHSKKYLHGDFKLANIFKSDSSFHLVLGDFGLSRNVQTISIANPKGTPGKEFERVSNDVLMQKVKRFNFSEKLYKLIERMIEREPNKRITLGDMRNFLYLINSNRGIRKSSKTKPSGTLSKVPSRVLKEIVTLRNDL